MIYCSTTCQGKGEEEMEKDNTTKEIIRELQQEIIEKDKYIASMKKRSLAFEDDVIEIEKNYNDEIQTYKRQIQNIEQQLAYLSSKNSTLQELTTSLLMEEPPVANDIRATSFQMKTNDMCKSQPIEHEFDEHQTASTFAHCTSIVSPIPQLDGEVAAESARQTPKEFDDAPIIDIVPSGGSPKRNASDSCRKIIIIGDEYAKSFRKVLELYTDMTKFSIKAHVYPNLEFVDITKNVFNITKSLGENDFVIFMINSNNISNTPSLNKGLHCLLPLGRVTNLIFLCELTTSVDYHLRNIINTKVDRLRKLNRNYSLSLFYDIRATGSKMTIIQHVKDIIFEQLKNVLPLKTVQINIPDKSEKQFFLK
ncbi:unnamed protein product [Acanthoscelides obtectus]|nr:unnamed protein product [Acanthoscelides obtectus]CAK1672431.1 hypothetical protein AOBTE_LOCUS28885 [Acanthoscelides obtectus]